MDKNQIEKIIKNKQALIGDIYEAIANLPEGVREAFLASIKDRKALSERVEARHLARWGVPMPKGTRPNNQREIEQMQKTMMKIKE
jgi:thiamine pyrophosphate-dependent acetolactate synthase large subunit-like protein